jgi:hypothetical protein
MMLYMMRTVQWPTLATVVLVAVFDVVCTTRGTAVQRVRRVGVNGIPLAADAPVASLLGEAPKLATVTGCASIEKSPTVTR